VVVARCAFVYQFVPEKLRLVRVQAPDEALTPKVPVYPNHPPTHPPSHSMTTIRQQRAAKEPTVPIVIPPVSELSLSLEPVIAAHPLIDLIETLPLCPSG
jgi:hypothetical protein